MTAIANTIDVAKSKADAMPTPLEVPQPDPSADLRRTFVLHDGGDALLLIGPEENCQPVLVSKTVLALASPVWKAMFDRRQWAESTATEIPFPDDDAEAMLIVLRIAHLRFAELPLKSGLSLEDLLHLAVICDKYDVVQLVRPFLNLHQWHEGLVPNVKARVNCHPSWLFIAWTFGWSDIFDSLAEYLTLTTSLNSDNLAICGAGEELSPEEMPAGLFGMYYFFVSLLLTKTLFNLTSCRKYSKRTQRDGITDADGMLRDCQQNHVGKQLCGNRVVNLWTDRNVTP